MNFIPLILNLSFYILFLGFILLMNIYCLLNFVG